LSAFVLTAEKAHGFLADLRSLYVAVDKDGIDAIFEDVHRLAIEHRLSGYDAAYLELALRKGLPSASLDEELNRAATAAGVALVRPQGSAKLGMRRASIIFLTIAHLNCIAQIRNDTIAVGAIRWDAWHGDRSEVGKAVERSLSPNKWYGRLPFFAQMPDDDRVRIDDASQSVIDREIRYARMARLDYWAFLLYDSGSPMNLGLRYYLSSHYKKALQFWVIVEPAQWETPESAAAQFKRVADLMARREYQRVAGGRPLLYVLHTDRIQGLIVKQRGASVNLTWRSINFEPSSGGRAGPVVTW